MEDLISAGYSKSTKVIDATYPRSNANSTLAPCKDKLSVVYDVYIPARCGQSAKPRVNLIFLHGSGMNRCIWEYYVAHLQEYELNWSVNKIVLVDQVTHGDSAVLNGCKLGVDFDWSDGARDVCKIAQEEFFEGVAAFNVVIGHSMGGFQAMCCGILMPGLFQLIITIEPVALMYTMENVNDKTILPPKLHAALNSKMQDRFRDVEEYEQFIRKGSFFNAVHPDILQRIIDSERIDMPDGSIKTKMSREQNILCYMTIFPTSSWLLHSLRFLKVPVVSLVGEIARWGPKNNQDVLKKLTPNYTQDVIPGGDHLVNVEMPNETLGRLLCHISKFVARQDIPDVRELSNDERKAKFGEQFEAFCEQRIHDGPMILSKF